MLYWNESDLNTLPFWLLGIIIITLIVWLLFRNKTTKIKMIPLMVIIIIMIISEIIKQINAICDGYDLYTLPLHFCSLFLYVFPLMVFCKGKLQDFGKTMSFISATLMLILYLISPSNIIGNNAVADMFTSYSVFHAVIYHHLAILFLFIGLSLKLFTFDKKHIFYVLIGITIYALIAIPTANILNVNFCDLLYNNFAPLQNIRQAIGNILYYILIYVSACLFSVFIFYLHYFVTHLKTKNSNQK